MTRGTIISVVAFLLLLGGFASLSPVRVQKMQGFFLGMMSPFLNTGSSMQRKVAAFQGGLSTLQQLETEVKNLRLENRNLKATNQLLADLAGENKRLRTALTYRERSTFKLLPARVISRDPSSWWNTVRIDRGFADGVKTDMAVLTEEGLVGKTTTVAKNISIVLLVSDENCKVASNVEGTREQGILAGERMANSQAPSLMLRFLSREANLQPGQKIFSSGVGGVFPAGVLLGTVREFTAMELDGRASIVPAVDLTTLDDVFVVKETR